MILYRPVGLQELEIIYDSGMKAFPARLPQQPIFYPVLDLEYARQTASDWNTKNGHLAGYVTQFKVEDQYIDDFEPHAVGGTQHQEFWIPTEEVDEFNKHIMGHIKVVEAYFGDDFQGYIPDKFGLEGKNAVEQFTLLANSYVYKRMDFYLEIKRNHKAIFLNYPFWQEHEFKNQGLKGKVLQGIREAWLTSFPQTPLPQVPSQVDNASIKETEPPSSVEPAPKDTPSAQDTRLPKSAAPVHQKPMAPKQTTPRSFTAPIRAKNVPLKTNDEHTATEPVPEKIPHVNHNVSRTQENPAHPVAPPAKNTESYFAQGLQLGISGQYHEAIEKLSKAVEQNRRHVAAHVSLGVAFQKTGEDARALACYETALELDPKHAEAHYFRANILYSQGKIREAIAEYRIAIGLAPELIEAHQSTSPTDRLTDYNPTAAEMPGIARPARRILELNKSIEAAPRQAYLYKERAAEYTRLSNDEKAIADYSAALAIQPDDANAHHLRGLAYEQSGQLDRALEDYQQSNSVDPQLSNLYINRGITFGQMGHYRQSITSLTEGIRLAPRNPDGYFNRGMTYIQQGDFEKAIDDFSKVVELSPNDEAAYYWRGISNEEAGRRQEAIADYRQFLVLSRDENARIEIENRLGPLDVGESSRASQRTRSRNDRLKSKPTQEKETVQAIDLHSLVVALGERAIHSTWFGSDVDCYGERAEELYAFTEQNKPIEGQNFLHLTEGIRQTIKGDFQAYESGVESPWIFIRAWQGSGFYIETNDPGIKKRLKTSFRKTEDVGEVPPPYEGLFIHV